MAEGVASLGVAVRSQGGRAVKLTASRRLYGLGAILLVSLTICARRFEGQGEAFPVVPLLVAGVAYLLATREFFCTQRLPRRVVVIGLVLAAVWQVAFLGIPTGSDDDVRRYVWDGRLQRLGYNPYIVVPNDPVVAGLHTAETRALNHPGLPSPYPPGALLFFRAITAIHESVLALRVAFVICDVAIVLVLLDVLRETGQGMHWVLAFAWNPLLATETAGSGHVDIVGVLLLVVAFAALLRRWRTIGTVAFALAVAVKFLPIVLLPLLLAAGADSRRCSGCRDVCAFVPAVYSRWADSGGLARHLPAELSIQRSGVYMARANGDSAGHNRTCSSHRRFDCNVVQSQISGIVCGRIRMADGRVASVRSGRVSVVFALDAAIHEIGFDVADRHLDGEHHPDVHRLASAHGRTPVGASGLGFVAGVRIGRGHRRDDPVAAGSAAL